jgi:hypothetical protein
MAVAFSGDQAMPTTSDLLSLLDSGHCGLHQSVAAAIAYYGGHDVHTIDFEVKAVKAVKEAKSQPLHRSCLKEPRQKLSIQWDAAACPTFPREMVDQLRAHTCTPVAKELAAEAIALAVLTAFCPEARVAERTYHASLEAGGAQGSVLFFLKADHTAAILIGRCDGFPRCGDGSACDPKCILEDLHRQILEYASLSDAWVIGVDLESRLVVLWRPWSSDVNDCSHAGCGKL